MSFLRISFLTTTMELYRNIREMFNPSLLSYNTASQMPLDISLRKTNRRQVSYLSVVQKYGQEQTLVTKMLNSVFFHACFKEKYFTSSANISYFK